MRQFLLGSLFTLAVLAGTGAWLWFRAPEYLPEGLRQRDKHSPDYRPVVYRWKDAQGRTQLTDTPPTDRSYETVRIDPNTNIVPDVLPRESELKKDPD